MIIIDNYDSFTYNIVEYFKILGKEPIVYKNDKITINKLKKKNFDSIVISPGPNSPKEAGISLDVIDSFKDTKKILGVCLGHQAIAQYFGSKIIKKEPCHGQTSKIFFKEDERLFSGFKQGFLATRYHSLIVEKENEKITKTAWLDDGTIMALRVSENIFGVQFHPEAILTQGGINIFKNFLEL